MLYLITNWILELCLSLLWRLLIQEGPRILGHGDTPGHTRPVPLLRLFDLDIRVLHWRFSYEIGYTV